MLDQIRARIEAEIERLTHELTVALPKAIRIAVEHGDLRENADYKSALERQQFVQARINHLTRRMGEKIESIGTVHSRQIPPYHYCAANNGTALPCNAKFRI